MAYSEQHREQLLQLGRTHCGDDRAETYYHLGLRYAAGSDGVDIDYVEAHKWFNLAAINGYRSAQVERAAVAAEMSALQIAEAQRQAREWLRSNAA